MYYFGRNRTSFGDFYERLDANFVSIAGAVFAPPSNGLDDTAEIQKALDDLPRFKTLVLSDEYIIKGAGCSVTNKTDVSVVGPGRLKLSGANSDATLLRLIGTCTNVLISNVGFIGEGLRTVLSFQNGIWSPSGQTLTNIAVKGCNFSNLNSGISYNADAGGTIKNVFALDNELTDMVGYNGASPGAVGGQGYGIHISRAKNAHIRGNTITRAERHSIYAARGSITAGDDYGTFIHDNIIIDHRINNAFLALRPAIYCVRGYGYSIKNNKIIGYFDGGIAVSHDTFDGTNAGDSVISGNELSAKGNAVTSIWVGESINPVANKTVNVEVTDNTIRGDYAVAGNSQEIEVYNGIGIEVARNKLYIANIGNVAYRPITVGLFAAGGVTDLDSVRFVDNRINGSSAFVPIRMFYVGTGVCSGASRIEFLRNTADNSLLNLMVEFAAARTNARLVYEDQFGGMTGFYVAAATTLDAWGGIDSIFIDNAAPVSITTINNGSTGQILTLTFGGTSNITLKHATGNMRLAGGVDFVSGGRNSVTLKYSSVYGQWLEISRALAS